MSLRRRTSIVVAGLVAALPAIVRAQSGEASSERGLSISAVSTNARHELLGDPLIGVGARLGIPVGSRAFTAHFSADRVTGSAPRITGFCSFPVDPEDPACVDQPANDDARMDALSAGIGFEVLDRSRVTVDLAWDLGLARVRVDTRSRATNSEKSAEKNFWTGMAAFEASWSPWTRLPIAIEAGVAAGFLKPFIAGNVVDGYTPLDEEIGFTRIRVGVAWRPMRW